MKKLLIGLCFSTILIVSHVCLAASAQQDFKKANNLFAKKNYKEAIGLYQELLSEPSCPISTGVLHTRLADSYFKIQDYVNARTSYQNALQVLKDDKERASTQYWIGFCTLLMGKNDEAVEEFLKIPRLYADSGMWVSTAYYWVARVYERSGKKELAAEYFRKAAAGNANSTQGEFALKKAEKLNK